MYNKYIFINNKRRKKQKELENQKESKDSQISFDMLANTNNKNTENRLNKGVSKQIDKRGKNITNFIRVEVSC